MVDPALPGTRQARGRARRRAIVEAAAELFSRHGYKGTSVAAVAEAAGITDAGLLYHFPTKEDLLLAVLQHQDRIQATLMDPGGAAPTGLAVIEQVAAWGPFMEREADLIALHVKLGGEHLRDDSPANAYFRMRYDFLLGYLRGAIEAGQAAGEIDPGFDPQEEAMVILAVVDGLRLQWFFVPDAGLAGPLRTFIHATVARLRR